MKRIGMFITIPLLAATLSACCFGPHRDGGHYGGPGDSHHHYDRR